MISNFSRKIGKKHQLRLEYFKWYWLSITVRSSKFQKTIYVYQQTRVAARLEGTNSVQAHSKSVPFRSFSGPYFPVFELYTET